MSQCRFVCKNGTQCKKGAYIDGLCTTHFCIENGMDVHSDIRSVDVTIHLWKKQ